MVRSATLRDQFLDCCLVFPPHTALGSALGPEPVDEREIESLKTLVQSRLEYDPHPGLAAGMEVQVVRGPLIGVRGILIRKEARCRLVISVNVIRQGAAVAIDAVDVAPA